jgi:hypothetical protein
MVFNRNKRSLTPDLRAGAGKQVLRELLAQADVLVENFVPGTLEAMGFDWDTLHALNPRLILTRISGFGQTGPLARKPCFDVIAQSMSGLMDITGDPGGRPTMAGTYIVDYSTGMYATIGALQARERTGRGQVVDAALLDSAMSMLMTAIPEQLLLGRTMSRRGNRDRYGAPANSFPTRDEAWAHLATAGDAMFRALSSSMGEPELADDPRFRDNAARLENVEALEAHIAGWTRTLTAAELLGAPVHRRTLGEGDARVRAGRASAARTPRPDRRHAAPEGRAHPHAGFLRPLRRHPDAPAARAADARPAHRRSAGGMAVHGREPDRQAAGSRRDLTRPDFVPAAAVPAFRASRAARCGPDIGRWKPLGLVDFAEHKN